MKKFTTIAAIAGLMVLAGGMAEAATSTQTLSKSAPFTTNWSTELDFNKFDSSLGTLTGVEYSFTSSINTTITVTYTGDSTSQGDVQTRVRISLVDPEGHFGDDAPQSITFTPNVAPTYSLTSEDPVVVLGPYSRTANSGVFSYNSAEVLGEFTGSGTIPLIFAADAFSVLTNTGGNTTAAQTTTATGTVTLVYEYTAVPEPTTALLIGAGGVCMLMARRRRSA